jgi:hypothetical protein
MTLVFVYMPLFERTAEGLLDDEDMQTIENQLLADPRAGAVIPGTGGVRKLRVAFAGRGKSGSGRIISIHVVSKAKVYFLLLYPKNRMANLSEAQKQQMRQLVKQIEDERHGD